MSTALIIGFIAGLVLGAWLCHVGWTNTIRIKADKEYRTALDVGLIKKEFFYVVPEKEYNDLIRAANLQMVRRQKASE